MAGNTAKARKAVLDLIAEVANVQAPTSNVNDKIDVQIHKARSILILSEAHAWLMSPAQTHGSPPTSAK
jgi:hypothetical protein